MIGRAAPRTLALIVSIALSMIVIAGSLLAFSYLPRTVTEEPAIRFEFSPPDGVTLTNIESGGAVTISPDGTRLAFVATEPDGRQLLWVRPLESLTAQRLDWTDGATYPFWSPDGQFIGFFAQGKLKRIHASGGPPQNERATLQEHHGH